MAVFDEFIYWLDYYSVADVLLPFILVFTVVYAALQKSKILGEDSKNFNVVISLVMGLSVVIPHVLGMYPKPSVVDIINMALPQISGVLVAIIMFMIMIGIFGKEISFVGQTLSGWAVIFSIIMVFLIFGSSANWFYLPDWLYFLQDPDVQFPLIAILVLGLVIWFVTHEPKSDDERKMTDALKDLGGIIKK